MTGPRTGFETADSEDARSVSELITALLNGPDDDAYWDAMWALRRRDTAEVRGRATDLCRSACEVERKAGVDIFAQLGVPDRARPEEGLSTLLEMLEVEDDLGVLQSILIGLGHFHDGRVVVRASRFRGHPDSEIRYSVVRALMGQEDTIAIAGLIELSRDERAKTRDWATFALGSIIEVDTPALRGALFERLTDEDEQTRDEALVGLARRKDRRVLPVLSRELSSDSAGPLAIEAAELMAEPELGPLLVAIRDSWGEDIQALNEAILACSPNSFAAK